MATKLTHLAAKADPKPAHLGAKRTSEFLQSFGELHGSTRAIWELSASARAPKMVTELTHLAPRSGPECANG